MKALLIIALTVLGLSACNEPTINTRYLCNQKEATLSVINEQTAALTLNNNLKFPSSSVARRAAPPLMELSGMMPT